MKVSPGGIELSDQLQITLSTRARRLLRPVFMMLGMALYGTFGHYLFMKDNHSLFECGYRTMMMLATVNEAFSATDVSPDLRSAFMIFELTLVVFGIAVILYSLSLVTASIVEGDLQEFLRQRKMSKEISRFRNHFIVCGAGSTGIHIINELKDSHRPFVVVERDSARVEKLKQESIPCVEGNALEDQVLIAAGITWAAGIAIALPSDRDNLFVTLTARQLNPSIRIAAKGSDPNTDDKLKAAGADVAVSPAKIGGMRIASQLIRPSVVSFLDKMMQDPVLPTRIEEIRIHQSSELEGQSIVSSKFRQRTGLQILALRLPGEDKFSFHPDPNAILESGTTLVVLGPTRLLAEAMKMAGMDSTPDDD